MGAWFQQTHYSDYLPMDLKGNKGAKMEILETLPITWETIQPHQPSDFSCQICQTAIATTTLKCQIDTMRLNIMVCGDCASMDPDDIEAKVRGKIQTVAQASGILKVNESRVRQFIYAGRLPAQKIGRDLLIKTDDVLAFAAVERKTGRPIERAVEGNENEEADR